VTVNKPSFHAPPRRVLIVEDEALIALVLEECIRDLGYDCVGPFTGLPEAMPIARSAPLDAAIFDIKLDGGISYELPEILAARRIPFGFATGYPQVSLDGKWADRPYMAKPFDFADVQRMLLMLLPQSVAR